MPEIKSSHAQTMAAAVVAVLVGAGGGSYLGWQPEELANKRVELATCEARLEAITERAERLVSACEE